MSEKWSVYRHTFPNGKVYIGITNQFPENRWGLNGINYRKQQKMLNAIMKFGWDNVVHEVLYTGLTEHDASKIEQKLIEETGQKGACGNYNVFYAPKIHRAVKSEIITEESLHKRGKYMILPDAAYDRFVEIYGSEPITLWLETDCVRFQIAKKMPCGTELTNYEAKYPKDTMTFDDVSIWLSESHIDTEIINTVYISDADMERAIAELKVGGA